MGVPKSRRSKAVSKNRFKKHMRSLSFFNIQWCSICSTWKGKEKGISMLCTCGIKNK